MFTNKAFLFFYILLSLVQAILEICLAVTKALIRHCNQAVAKIALLHNTPLRCALGVDHVLTSRFLFDSAIFMQIILSKMSQLHLYSFARKLRPCISFRLHLGSRCPQYMATLLIKLHTLVARSSASNRKRSC